MRISFIPENAFTRERSHASARRTRSRVASGGYIGDDATGPLSFPNLPVQLNFTLWYPAIGHCARLVTQIILYLSKYGPRIVSTAVPIPYALVSNSEECTLSRASLDPLCPEDLSARFTHSRNDLSPLLQTALMVIPHRAAGASFSSYALVCTLMCTSLHSINILQSAPLFLSLFLCLCLFIHAAAWIVSLIYAASPKEKRKISKFLYPFTVYENINVYERISYAERFISKRKLA